MNEREAFRLLIYINYKTGLFLHKHTHTLSLGLTFTVEPYRASEVDLLQSQTNKKKGKRKGFESIRSSNRNPGK